MTATSRPSASTEEVTIHTSRLYDPLKKQIRHNISITVSTATGLITKVTTRPTAAIPPDGIDLTSIFVLPGFVDAHTHIFLHSYSERSSLLQMRDESPTERILRASNHCRAALLAGYTTYRDLGSEGLGAMDVGVRDSINRGIIPGPRLFVATDALASSGSYQVRSENLTGGLVVPVASDECDGIDGVRRAVRRRIAAGADVVKFYADYRRRMMRYPGSSLGLDPVLHPIDDPNPTVQVFRADEMREIVLEASMAKCPVVAHASSLEAATAAVQAGVKSIEHGFEADESLFRLMREKGCIFVPTLAVYENAFPPARFNNLLQRTKQAYDVGVKLACGGDTGTFPHGDNAREMELMIKAGLPVEEVLRAATLGGWESCGGLWTGMKFGWIAEGCRADIVGLQTSPLDDLRALRKVSFVMKDGRVWKQDGLPVGMI